VDNVFLYQHALRRSEWGYGAVTATTEDRTTFKFDDGMTRTITRDHIHLMEQVELEEPENSEVRKRIARAAKASSTPGGERKRVAKKKVKAAAAAPAPAAATEE
jgi:hypothetical protein